MSPSKVSLPFCRLRKKFSPRAADISPIPEADKPIIICNSTRNGQKWTSIQGLDETEAQLQDLVDFFKENYGCDGCLKEKEIGFAIHLQGDHRRKVSEYLFCEGLCDLADVRFTNDDGWVF
jgi:translation initiation factor 1 (eIF-1/SUI1)